MIHSVFSYESGPITLSHGDHDLLLEGRFDASGGFVVPTGLESARILSLIPANRAQSGGVTREALTETGGQFGHGELTSPTGKVADEAYSISSNSSEPTLLGRPYCKRPYVGPVPRRPRRCPVGTPPIARRSRGPVPPPAARLFYGPPEPVSVDPALGSLPYPPPAKARLRRSSVCS